MDCFYFILHAFGRRCVAVTQQLQAVGRTAAAFPFQFFADQKQCFSIFGSSGDVQVFTFDGARPTSCRGA